MDETSTSAKPASDAIRAQHGHLSATLPFSDRQDFEDARRGFIAALEPGVVRDGTGRVVWDIDSYGFLSGAAPDTVNPSLWRQSQLCPRTCSPGLRCRGAPATCTARRWSAVRVVRSAPASA